MIGFVFLGAVLASHSLLHQEIDLGAVLLVTALVQGAKTLLQIDESNPRLLRWVPLIALAIGVALSIGEALTQGEGVYPGIVRGVQWGLSAVGLYSGVRATAGR